jgi:glutamate-5-semialdehyde dehydrogenase
MDSIIPLLKSTRVASPAIARLSDSLKKELLNHLADAVWSARDTILSENQKDLDAMPDSDPKKDRLLLNNARIEALSQSLREIADLPDPTNQTLLQKELQKGLQLTKISVPLGVVGVIYESRPNVTLDVAALCLRSGNACVLKGGKEAAYSNQVLVDLIHTSLKAFSIPTEVVCLLPTDREFVPELLNAVRYVDIIIPRGSDQLIQFVRQNATVLTIETGAGVCHTYVHTTANLNMARDIVVNAKTSRPSVCNALDTLLVDQSVAAALLPMIIDDFKKFNVEVFADADAFEILNNLKYPHLQRAREEDFGREFLDFKCSIKVVQDENEALNHIETYSSRHSEAIVSESSEVVERFLNEVDAAAVYVNASTRFTDGGEFGLGAEIGISTQKLHARGPFALEKLVTEKWIVRGNGNIR